MTLPPGPQLPGLLQTLQIIHQPLAFLDRCSRRYGSIFTLRVLGMQSPPVVFVSQPEAIQSLFTTLAPRLQLGQITHVFRPLTGSSSLIMLDGSAHQRQRQLLMPPLHGERLSTYAHLIQALTQEVIQHWQVGDRLQIRRPMTQISLQVILRVVLGVQPGDRYDQLKRLIESFLETVTSPLYSLQFFFPVLQQDGGPWSPWGKFLQQRQEIDHLLYSEIAERRAQPDPQRDDILSLLLSAQDEEGQYLSPQELRDQLITLLLLGHETTASALSWAFYWIHRHPEVGDRLLQEIGRITDPDALAHQPYLTAVCKEALRIYPIALIAQPRVAREHLTLAGYDLEPGTVLVPCIYLSHRDPQQFPAPDQFQPQRFLERKMSPYEYFPFVGGSRSCIGMALSLFEMKLILATVLTTWQLQLQGPTDIQPIRRGITFVPDERFRLQVLSRQ